MPKQTLAVLPDTFVIHSLPVSAQVPSQVLNSSLYFIGKTHEELSIVIPESIHIESDDSDTDWKVMEVLGPLELSMVGIMAQIGEVLASAKVAIFVVSTFDTDFFLVKDNKLKDAVSALKKAGYSVNEDV